MKAFIEFITALVVLAIVQSMTVALGVVLIIFTLMSAVVFPRQTFGLLIALSLLALALNAPVVCAASLGAIVMAVAITSRLKRRSPLPASLKLLPSTNLTER